MYSQQEIQEDSFSSDEDFNDEEEDTDSSSNADEKVAQDEVFDEEFFKCYSALKKKDSKIYDKNVTFFSDKETSTKEVDEKEEVEKPNLLGLDKKSKKESKMTILDHQLNVDNDAIEELEAQKHKLEKDFLPVQPQSYYDKELEEIKKSIVEVSGNVESDSDEDLLVVKKTDSETGPSSLTPSAPGKKVTALLDQLEKKGDEDIRHLKQIWSEPEKLTDDDKFLRDYILNKRYIPANAMDEIPGKGGFFSKNLEDMSDVDEEDDDKKSRKKDVMDHHSNEKDFDKIVRIPRNSTNTIRDLVGKQQKKEKRLKKIEKIKKKKKAFKDADFEDIIGDLPTKFHYKEIEPVDFGMTAEEILLAPDPEDDLKEREKAALEPSTSKRKRKKKRKMNREKFAKTGVAPDRLLAYGLSKSKLKKSKLL